jgi:hypothetical protein
LALLFAGSVIVDAIDRGVLGLTGKDAGDTSVSLPSETELPSEPELIRTLLLRLGQLGKLAVLLLRVQSVGIVFLLEAALGQLAELEVVLL